MPHTTALSLVHCSPSWAYAAVDCPVLSSSNALLLQDMPQGNSLLMGRHQAIPLFFQYCVQILCL